MSRAQLKRSVFILICLMAILLAAIICTGSPGGEKESIQAVMRDAVLHEGDQVSLFGLMDVNPGLISAFTVTGVIFVVCLILRIFVIPKFQYVPGKVQLVLEEIVNLFDGLAKTNSPHRNKFLSVYLFTAGVYIFIGTIFELFGVQAVTVAGNSVSLPAPLSDVNGAIALGCLSYVIILSGGIAGDGANGVGKTLKEFSLPISMSFRLFGALLSGALVTELVYYYIQLSFVLPVIVGVLFTLLHALIQAYVLTMLTALFYGEVSEPTPRKPRKAKKGKRQKAASQP
jgi:F-type H+-transporting ATPase subunit a